ncbi:MAG: nuclear transport factor 2 family protein [Burkholderiales bacterium]
MRLVTPLVASVVCALLGACAGLSPGAAQGDLRDLTGLAGCYADGIDAIGAGKTDAGAERWRQCFSEDLRFSMTFGTAFSMTCPGEKCPFPPSMNGLARRVALAKGTFERAGYVATSHHITSVAVQQSAPDAAVVTGHLQAWHMRKDGAAVVGLGTWQVQARKTAIGWRITDEQLESPLRVVMPKAE